MTIKHSLAHHVFMSTESTGFFCMIVCDLFYILYK